MDPVALPVTEGPNFMGSLLVGLYGLLAPLLMALVAYAVAWVRAKTQDVTALRALGSVAEVAQSVVAHVEISMRPLVAKALEDGKLTPEEATELKKHALDLVKDSLGTEGLERLKKALGLTGDGAVATYLSGLIERALGLQRAAGTLPPPAPNGASSSFQTAPSPIR